MLRFADHVEPLGRAKARVGVAVCNKGPDLGVVPRFESVEVEGRVSRVEGRGT